MHPSRDSGDIGLRLHQCARRGNGKTFPSDLGSGGGGILPAHRRIGASVHFIPLHHHTYYRRRYGSTPARFPVADDAFARVVSLPLSAALSLADVADAVEAVRDVLRRYRR